MIFSGYLPQSAKARVAGSDAVSSSNAADAHLHDPFDSITRRVPADYSAVTPRRGGGESPGTDGSPSVSDESVPPPTEFNAPWPPVDP